jgi:hypothetical protein
MDRERRYMVPTTREGFLTRTGEPMNQRMATHHVIIWPGGGRKGHQPHTPRHTLV